MKIRSPWKLAGDQARQGYTQLHTLSSLLGKTSRVWTERKTTTPSQSRSPIGSYFDIRARSAQSEDEPREGGGESQSAGGSGADEPIPTTGSPASRILTDDLVGSATSTGTSDVTATPSTTGDGSQTVTVTVILSDPTGLGNPTNQTWITSQTATISSSPTSTNVLESEESRFGPMSLNGDEVVALIAGCIILVLLFMILSIWLCLRDRNLEGAGSESNHEFHNIPPTISLSLPSSNSSPQPHDVLGRAAETGPGTPNWPLPQNQIRIPLRPRPKRRTLSSELSPFGYIYRSDVSDAGASGNGGVTRPASISAAWLSPLRGGNGRGAAHGGGNSRTSTAPASARNSNVHVQPPSSI